jgi:SWIM zinc finger
MTTVEQTYNYRGASTATAAATHLTIDFETAGGCDQHPVLAEGFVKHPHATAQALLLVAKVAATRFWTPPNMLAAVILAADPVITAWSGGLRFESFSLCCGVYCRFDLDADGFDGTIHRHGTTNVDVNAPLKAALTRIGEVDPLLIRVGHDDLTVSTLDGQHIEKRVPLPERWVRGFAEAAVAQSSLEPHLHLQPAGIRRFIGALPTDIDQSGGWISPSGNSARWSSRPTPGAISLGGAARLRVLRNVAPILRELSGFGELASQSIDNRPSTTSWVGETPGGRITIALSPAAARGFSGEGALLHALAAGPCDRGEQFHAHVQQLEAASAGRLGYDVTTADWFMRDLPFDRSSIDKPGGRLANARTLFGSGAVVLDHESTTATVTSGLDVYNVRLVGSEWRCTCPWWGRHRDNRGSCKHILATAMFIGRVAPS